MSASVRRALVRIVYLLPLLLGLLLLIYAAIPHLWFVYEGKAYETQSLLGLCGNVWESYQSNDGYSNASEQGYRSFGRIMGPATILFWVIWGAYLLFSLAVCVCSLLAFSLSPTDRLSNRTKRVLQLICPGRVSYCIFCALPVIPSLFAQLLSYSYRSYLGMQMKLFCDPFSDWGLACVLCACSIAGFLLALGLQRKERLDMFRIYRRDIPMKEKEKNAS